MRGGVTNFRIAGPKAAAERSVLSGQSTRKQFTWTYYGLHAEAPYARRGLEWRNLSSVTTRDKRRSVDRRRLRCRRFGSCRPKSHFNPVSLRSI